MFFNVVLPWLAEWMPLAVVLFAVLLVLFAEVPRKDVFSTRRYRGI